MRTPEQIAKHTKYYRVWRALNPDKSKIANKKCRDKVKLEVFTHMGGKCACCGIQELDFLAVDHIEDLGGSAQRKITGEYGHVVYTSLRDTGYPSGYQLLCFNCNFSKFIGRGTCIHQRLPGINYYKGRKRNLVLKTKVITDMGGKCSCCDITEIDFLAVDHINGGGQADRKTTDRSGETMYRFMRDNNYPPGYQIMCHNCNWSKHLGNGICIHKRVQS